MILIPRFLYYLGSDLMTFNMLNFSGKSCDIVILHREDVQERHCVIDIKETGEVRAYYKINPGTVKTMSIVCYSMIKLNMTICHMCETISE